MVRTTIKPDHLSKMEIDEETRELYWNGKKIKTDANITLGNWINLAVFLGGVGATMSAIIAWAALSFAMDQADKVQKIDVQDTVDVNLLSVPDLVKVEQNAPTITIVCPSGEQNYNLPTEDNNIAVVCEGVQASNMDEQGCIRYKDSKSLWICR